jgi:hypothetical protein
MKFPSLLWIRSTRLLDVPTRTLVACALLAPLTTASCNASQPAPFVGDVSRSEFWEYHDEVTEPLCSALLPLLDQHAEVIAAKIGLPFDRDHPFRYYRFRDLAGVAAACGVEAGGCVDAWSRSVYAPTYFEAHEQAHAYIYRAWGWSVDLLNEGAAVALSCSPFLALDPTRRPLDTLGSPAWRELFGTSFFIDGDRHYTAAGLWVTYLARRYGWQAVAELYLRVPGGTLVNDFEREFARVFPMSVDQAWSEALSTPGAPHCTKDWLCGAPPLGLGEDVPYCNGQIHRTIAIPDQAGFVVSLGSPVGCSDCYGEIGLVSCGDGGWPRYTFSSGGPTTHWVLTRPGSYSVVTDLFEQGISDTLIGNAPSEVRLESYLPTGFVGDTCDAAGAVELDSDRTELNFLGDVPAGWIRLHGGGRSYLVTAYYGGATAGAPVVCDSCDAAASCQPLPFVYWDNVTISDDAVLRLSPGSTTGPPPLSAYLSFYAWPPTDAGT